jgi:hypothetical protein
MNKARLSIWLFNNLNHPYARALLILAILAALVIGGGAPEGLGGH